jgi:hypothetical protein
MATFPKTSQSTYEVVIKGVVSGALDSKPVVNILHYSTTLVTPDFDNRNLPGFLAQLRSIIAASWGALKPNAYVCSSVTGRWMEDSSTGLVFDTTPASYTGNYTAGDWQPPDITTYMEKVTAGHGKSYRGGIHLSPVPEAGTLDFRVTSPYLTLMSSLAAVLMTRISWTDGLGSYAADPFLVSTKLSSLVVSGICVIRGANLTQIIPRKTLGKQGSRAIKGVY